ncbi:hypothetical protein PAXINDRAFT_102115 [Paxillus involutus ATCC 200175]|uniref:Unplaced genomic scaffold PAXINscaffold_100, whole genome shotgun sequence n=1 Tax=Paxillus involutus ATCC 200175 TaxID=664439 RepID=A0A0C9SQX0_PAXIN|nr:hypothetical protein PAXINDRAFT_102115 [Paxillus involutus ATCC 200175]
MLLTWMQVLALAPWSGAYGVVNPIYLAVGDDWELKSSTVETNPTLRLLIMQLQVPAIPDGIQVTYVLAGIVVAAFVAAKLSKRPNLNAIPTVGCSTWLGSWWAGIQFMTKAADVLREGYEKHKGALFKVADLYRWTVIVSGPQFVEDVRKASDDELSFMEATNDNLNTEYTLGHDVHHNPYHVAIIRSQLTRNLGILFPDIRDEIVIAFEETLDLQANGEHEFSLVSGIA